MLANDSPQGSKRNTASSTPTKKPVVGESSAEASPTDHHALFLKAYKQGRAKMAAKSAAQKPASGGNGTSPKVPTLQLNQDTDAQRVAMQVDVVNEIERSAKDKSRTQFDSDSDQKFSALNESGRQTRTPVKSISLKQLAASFGKSLEEHEKAISDVELSTTTSLQINPTSEIDALNRQIQEMNEKRKTEDDAAALASQPAYSTHLFSPEVVVEADMGFRDARAPRQTIGKTVTAAASSELLSSTQSSAPIDEPKPARSVLAEGLTLSELSGSGMSSWKLSTGSGLTTTVGAGSEQRGVLTTDEKVKRQLAELEAVLHSGQEALTSAERAAEADDTPDPVQAVREAGEAAAALRDRLKLNLSDSRLVSAEPAALSEDEAGGASWQSAKAGLRAELQMMQELQQREAASDPLDAAHGADHEADGAGEEEEHPVGVAVAGGAPWAVRKDKLKAEVQRMRQQLLLAQQARWSPGGALPVEAGSGAPEEEQEQEQEAQHEEGEREESGVVGAEGKANGMEAEGQAGAGGDPEAELNAKVETTGGGGGEGGEIGKEAKEMVVGQIRKLMEQVLEVQAGGGGGGEGGAGDQLEEELVAQMRALQGEEETERTLEELRSKGQAAKGDERVPSAAEGRVGDGAAARSPADEITEEEAPGSGAEAMQERGPLVEGGGQAGGKGEGRDGDASMVAAGVFSEGAVDTEKTTTLEVEEVEREDFGGGGQKGEDLEAGERGGGGSGAEREATARVREAGERVGEACRGVLLAAVLLFIFGVFSPWGFAAWGVALPLGGLSALYLARMHPLPLPSDAALPRPLVLLVLAFNFLGALSLLAVILCAAGADSIAPLMDTPFCSDPEEQPLLTSGSANASDALLPAGEPDADAQKALGRCQAWGLCDDGGVALVGCGAMRGLNAFTASVCAILAVGIPAMCLQLCFALHTRLQERERIRGAGPDKTLEPADVSMAGFVRALSVGLGSLPSDDRDSRSALRHPSWDEAGHGALRHPSHAPRSDAIGESQDDGSRTI